MTTTNQPSDAAKRIWQEAYEASVFAACEESFAAADTAAALVIDRHLTPSEPVAKAFCNKCGYHGPVDKHGQHIRPSDGNPCNYMATPPTTVNSDAGLVGEALTAEERVLLEPLLRWVPCPHCNGEAANYTGGTFCPVCLRAGRMLAATSNILRTALIFADMDGSQRAALEKKVAAPPAPANSDAGLVEADAALEAALKAAKAQLQECAQCLLDAERTIQSLSATPAVNAELVDELETALGLIQEAKGADGPNGGFITDHLDFAEHWINKVCAALSRAKGDGAQAAAEERAKIVAWLRFDLDDWPDYVAPPDIADAIEAGEHLA